MLEFVNDILAAHNVSGLLYYEGYIYSCSGDGINKCDINLKQVQKIKMNYTQIPMCIVIYKGCLYSGNIDDLIRKYNISTQVMNCEKSLPGHTKPITCFAVYNDYLYSGDYSGKIKKWKDDKCVQTLKGHISIVTCMTTHSNYLYSGGAVDETIRKWNDAGECIQVVDTKNWVCCLLSFNGYIYSGNGTGEIKKWNDYSDTPINTLIGHNEHKEIASITKNDDILYSGSVDYTIRKWKNDKCIQVFNERWGDSIRSMTTHDGYLYAGNYLGRILKFGEYWPHHYINLPTEQKEKIKNWRNTKLPIQKDIKFLFERELLV